MEPLEVGARRLQVEGRPQSWGNTIQSGILSAVTALEASAKRFNMWQSMCSDTDASLSPQCLWLPHLRSRASYGCIDQQKQLVVAADRLPRLYRRLRAVLMSQASKPKTAGFNRAGDMSGTGVDDCNKEDATLGDDEGDSSSSSYSSCDENATPKSTLSPLGGRVKRRRVLRLIAEGLFTTYGAPSTTPATSSTRKLGDPVMVQQVMADLFARSPRLLSSSSDHGSSSSGLAPRRSAQQSQRNNLSLTSSLAAEAAFPLEALAAILTAHSARTALTAPFMAVHEVRSKDEDTRSATVAASRCRFRNGSLPRPMSEMGKSALRQWIRGGALGGSAAIRGWYS